MTDVDDLLRRDAEAFRRTAPPAPDLDVLASAVTRAPARGRSWRLWVGAGLLTAAAVVAALAAAGLTSDHERADPALVSPSPSITVAGVAVPYAGPVPWRGAIADPADPRVVYVDADGDQTPHTCGLPEERVFVSADADRVTVSIAGYQAPLGPGLACGGVGHAPQRTRVVLESPLGGRSLVDGADGAVHEVVDPAMFPDLAVPAGFTPAPLSWDDRFGRVFGRRWTAPQTGSFPPAVSISVGPTKSVDENGTPSGALVQSDVPIGTALASVWRYTDEYNDSTAVRWTVSGERTVTVYVSGPVDAPPFDLDGAVALARTATVP